MVTPVQTQTQPQIHPHLITTPEQLSHLFDEVGTASITKEVTYLHPHYRAMIEASPFAVLASHGPEGMDASPRGDAPGFIVVEDEQTLLLPERRGNNRIDSLRNILSDPHVALLFLIPGAGETLRVNGRASISIEPALLERLAVDGKPPKCVLRIQVDAVYFQCARAILRSRLWQRALDGKPDLPSPGTILAALSNAEVDGEKYDSELPVRQRATLY
ncbi:pyridoxamine 5'-phosphate oxidase family protein [Undibacterium sp. TS12]|uniref:pyridoxamine 5'-phosphate oxidase family protein n=1 Tax=Undibacterium sp. TS12 TaxID=2908202 RepID=UPI001F4D2F51|nr:pyridoxamine 5'-phosphate oxidase family protein [Undibacterium sp. TS12]MCH8618321.1 pyridoxamine 5'-phosphate oxidase family protein [Undibacterium sp. TS12]